MAAAEVLGTLTSQKEPFSHSDMSTIYSKSQWKFKITIELTFMDNIKTWKKHCETHDWLLASHMKMLFLLGPFPTRRVVCREALVRYKKRCFFNTSHEEPWLGNLDLGPWLGNLFLGTLTWEPWLGNLYLGTCTWEPLLGNLYLGTCTWEPLLGNLHLGTFTWEPLLGNLYLGTCTSEPVLGNLYLGTCTWEPVLGNLDLGTLTWEPWLGNLDLGTLTWELYLGTFTWEPLLGNFDLGTLTWEPWLGNLDLGSFTWEHLLGNLYLGSFTWEHLLGNLYLGTFTWEPLFGNLYLGTFTWEPLLGNLGGIGFGAAPVCSETFTMAEDPTASAVGESKSMRRIALQKLRPATNTLQMSTVGKCIVIYRSSQCVQPIDSCLGFSFFLKHGGKVTQPNSYMVSATWETWVNKWDHINIFGVIHYLVIDLCT